jgi:hypothetical protein
VDGVAAAVVVVAIAVGAETVTEVLPVLGALVLSPL